MKKAEKILAALICICCILEVFTIRARAEENGDEISITEMNQVMTVLTDCDAREIPDDGAEVVMSYAAGSSVWIVGETEDGWYKVSYQGKAGFLPKESITALQVEIEEKGAVRLDEAGLDAEMAAVEAESELLVEEIERQRSEAKRSRIWTVVIVVLVIGIFVTGIISTINANKKQKKKD